MIFAAYANFPTNIIRERSPESSLEVGNEAVKNLSNSPENSLKLTNEGTRHMCVALTCF
jgi:hypothetical protein